MSNSEKWKKAKEENRAGNYKNNKHSEEMKNKISEGLKKYHASIDPTDPTIEKDNKLGKKVKQYDMNNNLLNEYISVSDASRKTSIPKSIILRHLKKSNGKEFIWKYA